MKNRSALAAQLQAFTKVLYNWSKKTGDLQPIFDYGK
jgi:hypothetical protein